jgi:hypothetical protein
MNQIQEVLIQTAKPMEDTEEEERTEILNKLTEIRNSINKEELNKEQLKKMEGLLINFGNIIQLSTAAEVSNALKEIDTFARNTINNTGIAIEILKEATQRMNDSETIEKILDAKTATVMGNGMIIEAIKNVDNAIIIGSEANEGKFNRMEDTIITKTKEIIMLQKDQIRIIEEMDKGMKEHISKLADQNKQNETSKMYISEATETEKEERKEEEVNHEETTKTTEDQPMAWKPDNDEGESKKSLKRKIIEMVLETNEGHKLQEKLESLKYKGMTICFNEWNRLEEPSNMDIIDVMIETNFFPSPTIEICPICEKEFNEYGDAQDLIDFKKHMNTHGIALENVNIITPFTIMGKINPYFYTKEGKIYQDPERLFEKYHKCVSCYNDTHKSFRPEMLGGHG